MMDSEVACRRFFSAEPDSEVLALLGEVPLRWGRMSPLCRLLIFEIGQKLTQCGVLKSSRKLSERSVNGGLIGATSKGSLFTDLEFIATMVEGPGLASPALFGYTLPNIPLAEAAAAFGLTGPVYAVFNNENHQEHAEREARLVLATQGGIDFMIGCSFDHYSNESEQQIFSVTLTVVE